MSCLLHVGLSHRTASVEIRECLRFPRSQLVALLDTLCAVHSPLIEAALLTTCNRAEVYALAEDPRDAIPFIEQELARTQGIPLEILRPHLRHAHDRDAVHHLCSVAAGLDSMILGEAQVLGQVVAAHEVAQDCGSAGPVLAALFRKAIECGKRARAETAIGDSAASVSYAAVELAKKALGTLQGRCVLLIGAGEMAQLAARNLFDNQAGQFLVVNRTYERAERLAQPFGGRAYAWDDMESALQQADIVLCSAGAPHTILHCDLLGRVCQSRAGRPLFLIDIGVPRNVDADAAELEGVHLYDIDDLQHVVQHNLAERESEIPRVEAIVQETTDEFMGWLAGRQVVSTIRDLRHLAEEICDDQVSRALQRLGPLGDREQWIVRGLGQSIVNKLLHCPTVRLKESAQQGNGTAYADVLRALFDLGATSTEERLGD